MRECLEALAAPGPVAFEKRLEGSVQADELALAYDRIYFAFLGTFAAELAPEQIAALSQVYALLGEMSGAHRAHLWTDDAVRDHPAWQEVREQAQRTLALIPWDDFKV